MNNETAAKRSIQKLQRLIVDALEGVKGQDIQVFNTETLSPLFERVIVASGTSNRQTRALAMAVRDAAKDAGFAKPRLEGEDNGEWIIVDCGIAVVHVMQPVIRQYYRLEELWGETPVRLGRAAAKTGVSHSATFAREVKAASKSRAVTPAPSVATPPATPRTTKTKTAHAIVKRPAVVAKTGVRAAIASTVAAQPVNVAQASRPTSKKSAAIAPAAPVAKKSVARKTPTKAVAVKKVVVKANTRSRSDKATGAKSTGASAAKKVASKRTVSTKKTGV